MFDKCLYFLIARKDSGKSREEAQKEKKQELKKQLEDVKAQLGGGAASAKKPNKKGTVFLSVM